MKKLIIPILSLSTLCFAKQGDADALAELVFLGLFLFIGLPALFMGIIIPIAAIGTAIATLWEKTNTFGKIICFCLPGTAITGTIFYFLFWIAIPYIVELVSEWPIVSASVTGGLYYISTILTGWKTCDNEIKKRCGKYALFSRIFTSIPIFPIIISCWLIKNLFCILFIKDYKVTNILGFWKPPEKELSIEELTEKERKEFFDKLAKEMNFTVKY